MPDLKTIGIPPGSNAPDERARRVVIVATTARRPALPAGKDPVGGMGASTERVLLGVAELREAWADFVSARR